jgi:hypothetical protein
MDLVTDEQSEPRDCPVCGLPVPTPDADGRHFAGTQHVLEQVVARPYGTCNSPTTVLASATDAPVCSWCTAATLKGIVPATPPRPQAPPQQAVTTSAQRLDAWVHQSV